MNILIDTLSMSWKYDNFYTLICDLGLVEYDGEPMKRSYYKHGEYYDGVLIAYNTNEENEITDTFLDISGTGCRFIETINKEFNWYKFLSGYDSEIRSKRCHISRLDVAMDIDDGSVTFPTIWRYSYSDLYVCRSKLFPKMTCKREQVIYFGSGKSDRLLRIYNKAMERGIPDIDWLRFEFQLRNDNATSFYLNWCKKPDDLGNLYAGILLDFIRFVKPPRGTSMKDIRANRHQGRLPTADWYRDLIGSVERIQQLYLPGEEYTLQKLEDGLKKSSYSRLKAYMIAHEGDITDLLEGIKHCSLNNRQRMMLSKLPHITKEDLGY